MGKAEVGTPKWIGNRIKSKGLQKLRWFCQMCEKQCRDENGFKCHMMSESHQRQLLLFGENPNSYLHDYSKQFEKGYTDILKRQYPDKRVHANVVYQQYIGYKEHVHMNSTCWVTLTSFIKHLGRTGKAVVDETEKGWFVTWVEKDMETQERDKRLAKKDKLAKDDDERLKEYIDMQIEKAKAEQKNIEEHEATELLKDEDEVVKLDLKIQERKLKEETKAELKNIFKDAGRGEKKRTRDEEENGKKKMSALEEIMAEEKKRKKVEKVEEKGETAAPWLRKNIVVKIVAKSLGDKYYKKKGFIKELVDDYVGLVVVNDTGAKLKLDQEHLETVIPQVGRDVVILVGKHRGATAVLRTIDTDKFSGVLKLDSGDKITLPYEHFSKKYVPS
ncbi:DNA/RNA-binding protein KIN17-like [Eurytemora carolleeae]|uniref:DNA/RNA-binding protein KIN17-like n=1 Tax=Eurytemora carolleeae TaxID=1294199 RepID=UPI000C775ADC|nr:DNA/RNA-binding protein KIN17-like [Eurytemora carolleeae]|eukprot:XP_023321483.1 DNA/RNA-binding protein KIN17-like [Eurytemora affinis]